MRKAIGYIPECLTQILYNLHSKLRILHKTRMDIVTLVSPVHPEWYILCLLVVPVPDVISLVKQCLKRSFKCLSPAVQS